MRTEILLKLIWRAFLLKSIPNDKMTDLSKFYAFADNKIRVVKSRDCGQELKDGTHALIKGGICK